MSVNNKVELTFYLEHLLSPLDVQQNVGECPDGVRVPPHHHVGKSRINKNNNDTWIFQISTTPFSLVLRKEYFDCPQRDFHAVHYI